MDWITACAIMEIATDASAAEVKEKRNYWAFLLAPDATVGKPENIRKKAAEEFIRKKDAWEYLLKPGNRPTGKQYGEAQESHGEKTAGKPLNDSSPSPTPVLEVEPRRIRFRDIAPSQKKSIMLVIRNIGGQCTKISVDYEHLSWITVSGIDSLNAFAVSNQIKLEGIGNCQPGEHHSCLITITAENERTRTKDSVNVEVELWMKPKDINNAEAYFHQGEAHFSKGDYAKAITYYSKAIKLDHKFANAYARRGYTYFRSGDYGKAIADHSRAIKLDPMFAQAYANRGEAYFHQAYGRHEVYWETAIADFNKAIDIDPTMIPQLNSFLAKAHYEHGGSYFYNGDYSKAIAEYTKAIEIDPKSANTYNDRGRAYAEKGDHDKAIADYTMAIKLNSQYADAYFFRGVAYDRIGEKRKTEADFNKAMELGCTWR